MKITSRRNFIELNYVKMPMKMSFSKSFVKSYFAYKAVSHSFSRNSCWKLFSGTFRQKSLFTNFSLEYFSRNYCWILSQFRRSSADRKFYEFLATNKFNEIPRNSCYSSSIPKLLTFRSKLNIIILDLSLQITQKSKVSFRTLTHRS